MNVTIKDVAKLAGVSASTVSRALADHPAISEQTKIKVKRAVDQLGYGKGSFKFKVRKTLHTIGIPIPTASYKYDTNSFILEAITGISCYCSAKNYGSILIAQPTVDEIIATVKNMYSCGSLDGIILPYSISQDKLITFLKNVDIPFIIIGKPENGDDSIFYIDNDNIMAARQGTNYLINLGHTKIAYIGAKENLIFSKDRKAGYLLSLAENRIDIRASYTIEGDVNSDGLNNKIQQLLSSKNRPTAVLACDDIFAMTIEKAAQACGLKIPKDLSIVSFNNSALAAFSNPPLTSIDINSRQLGREAASQLINYIENPMITPSKIIVPHQLIERSSCQSK
ncbi:transcriptional regulator, LacI family [Lachnospiraceae bacterium C7]|nr:transcriptional regulator, LacI family [Lachnospiraceae bacterium C7]